MGSRKGNPSHGDGADTDVRHEEVVRANKELAAYFRGKRTEREARSALKIIKAFIRDRERVDASKRRPLPGNESPRPPKTKRVKKGSSPADTTSDRSG
jgi:hypothetical protein